MPSYAPRYAPLPASFILTAALTLAPAAFAAEPFGEADIFFELNDTDGDLGIHALLDGDAWRRLTISSPDGKEKLRVVLSGTLNKHGLTELFFESAEPEFDELPIKKFFNRFKEGMWRFAGETIEGDELESEDLLSQVMPAPADGITLNGAPGVEDCDVAPLPVVTPPLTIAWDPVTSSHPDIGKEGPIEVVHYEFVIELDSDDSKVISMKLPPEVTSVEIPAWFLALDEVFKYEIITREEAGNQTAVESCFEVH